MKISPWCPIDPRLPCTPPFRSPERGPAILEVILEQLEGEQRYVARDLTGDGKPETCCNFYVVDSLAAQGIVIPRDASGNYLRANYLVATYFAHTAPWSIVEPWIAQHLVRLGVPCVVGQVNPSGPGHVARLRSPRKQDNPKGWYIGQAGSSNFTHAPIESGFGPNPKGLVFAVHP